MSFLAIFPKRRFIGPVIVIGILAISGALLKGWLLTHFQDFLLMVGTLFIPVSAIMVIDYYFLKRKHYDAEEIVSGDRKSYWYNGGVNYWSYVSYIVGAVFAYYFTYVHPLSTGATIWTFVVTAVVYWGLMKTVGFQSSQKNSEMDRSAVGESYKATKTELGVKK
jgi:purine-cytosine permease-like protein